MYLEVVSKRQYYLNLVYALMGLVLGIIGNLWVYYLSKFLETSFGLTSEHWILIFIISTLALSGWLILVVRYIWHGLRERIPRLLKYDRVTKNVQITSKEGDARVTWIYQGRNQAKTPISQIRHILRLYQTSSKEEPLKEDSVEAFLDGKKVDCKVETYKMERISDKANQVESEIFLDLLNPIEPGHSFNYRIVAHIRKIYESAFKDKGDFTYYRAHIPTDEITTKISPPEGYIVRLSTEESGSSCTAKDWHMILDLAETRRVNEDRPPEKRDKELIWKIDRPFLGYEYRINFKVTKG